MMRSTMISVLLALAACEKEAPKAPPAAPAVPAAPVPAPVVAAAAVPDASVAPPAAVAPAAPTAPAKPSMVEDVRGVLAAHGLQVKSVEKVGPMAEAGCAAPKRDRFMLAGNAHVDVSRFPTNQAAEACLTALHKHLAPTWPKVSQDYLVHGRWLAETSANVPVPEREKLREALNQAL